MFVEDFAEGLIFFMKRKISVPYVNIGVGKSYSINLFANFFNEKNGRRFKN